MLPYAQSGIQVLFFFKQNYYHITCGWKYVPRFLSHLISAISSSFQAFGYLASVFQYSIASIPTNLTEMWKNIQSNGKQILLISTCTA